MVGAVLARAEAPRVSIVIPVYNPGREIDPCIASVLAQTLPKGQVEAIFVDDGSTDETPARLDRLAADHPGTIRVIHVAPSGAPGRPRNIGLDAARGEYVQFLDADDELAPDALEVVVAMADRNRSDIVVEKFASASIPRSQRLFHRNVEQTTLVETPALVDGSLGPAKLFRRDFLVANGILFPEGWRLMEDQLFCIKAYLRATKISILADHPCYFFRSRSDGLHLTSEAIDPDRHFPNLRAVFDMVEAECRPGPVLDRIVRRLLKVEVLARATDPTVPDLPETERARLFAAARDFVRDRIGVRDVPGLDPIGKACVALLLEDRSDGLLEMARRLRDLELQGSIDELAVQDGSLQVDATLGLAFREFDRALVVSDEGDRLTLDPALVDGIQGHPIDVTAELPDLRVDIVLRNRQTALEWYVRARLEPESWPTRRSDAGDTAAARLPRMTPVQGGVNTRVDLMRVGAGSSPLGAGTWDVMARLSVFGITRFASIDLPDPGAMGAAVRPTLVGRPGRLVVPVRTESGLALEVDPPAQALVEVLPRPGIRLVRDGARLVLLLPIDTGPAAGAVPVEVIVRATGSDRALAGVLRPGLGGGVVDIVVSGLVDLPAGPHPLLLRLAGAADPAGVALGTCLVEGPSCLRVDGTEQLPAAERVRRQVLAPGRMAWRSLRRNARRSSRRLLGPIVRRARPH